MARDIVAGMDALVGADRDRGRGGNARHRVEIMRLDRLFEEIERAVAAAAPEIAIGADEGIHTLADIARHYERKAAHGVSLKAIKLGGLQAVAEAGRLCDSLGMNVNISCKTGESSIACAAALHVASVIPNIAWGLTLTHIALAEDVTAQPIRTARGHVDAIDRPGLGIDVDEDRVRRHRVAIPTRNVA